MRGIWIDEPSPLEGAGRTSRLDSELIFNPSVLADCECPECGWFGGPAGPCGHFPGCSRVKP